MGDITNQNYIYIYRLAMIPPVATMHLNQMQRNDKFNLLLIFHKGKIMLNAFVEIQLVVTMIAVVAAFSTYLIDNSTN